MQLTEHWGNMAKFALHNDKTAASRRASAKISPVGAFPLGSVCVPSQKVGSLN